jgi:hypothetical protein
MLATEDPLHAKLRAEALPHCGILIYAYSDMIHVMSAILDQWSDAVWVNEWRYGEIEVWGSEAEEIGY